MSGETIYSRAADRISESGWFKTGETTGSRRVCIGLALCDSADYFEGELAVGRVAAYLGEDPSDRWEVVPAWNDAPQRTVEDVLLVLKELHVEAGGA